MVRDIHVCMYDSTLYSRTGMWMASHLDLQYYMTS